MLIKPGVRPSGYFIAHDLDGKIEEKDSAQCCHCGMHFPIKPGSGELRGWCYKCTGPICGPKCVECNPIEKQLDEEEKRARLIIPCST